MNNMLHYIQWRGDLPFSREVPPCPVDQLVFSQLVFSPLERLEGQTGTLLSLRPLVYPTPPGKGESMLAESRYELWQLMDAYPRFAEVRLDCFRSSFQPEEDKQFAAALFAAGDSAVVAFRGTDASVVGWKEDFNLGLDVPLPGQRDAVEFLEQAAECADSLGLEHLTVCGHSKGGNLAMYSAAQCRRDVQDRIEGVYSFDGPGLPDSVMESEGWESILPRLRSFIPESSVIGLLLGNVDSTVVESDSVGLWQHNPFFWHVLGPGFVEAEDTTLSSRFMDQTLDSFLAQCPVDQRRILIETISEVLTISGASRMREVPKGIAAHFGEVRAALQKIPEENRGVLLSIFRALCEAGGSSFRALLDEWKKRDTAAV